MAASGSSAFTGKRRRICTSPKKTSRAWNSARGDILEFGSVALKTEQAKATHTDLIARAKKAGVVVCFDPNLRFNLWESKEELKAVVNEFAAYADVIKVGLDELEFITGLTAEKAVKSVFTGNLKMLLVTDGGKGAKMYLADGRDFPARGTRSKLSIQRARETAFSAGS